MSEEQQMPEYKQGDNVRLTVELRDQNGVKGGAGSVPLRSPDVARRSHRLLPTAGSLIADAYCQDPAFGYSP